jgi:hypothetical protein
MLFILFLFSIIALLAPRGAEPQITIDDASCGNNKPTVEAALNEMVDISDTAYNRTEELFTLNASVDELKIVLFTFDSYFGTNSDQQTDSSAQRILCWSFPNR